jgi:hypothetical protein
MCRFHRGEGSSKESYHSNSLIVRRLVLSPIALSPPEHSILSSAYFTILCIGQLTGLYRWGVRYNGYMEAL